MTKRRQILVTMTRTLISMRLIKYIAKPKNWLDSLSKTSIYSKKSDAIARNRRGEKSVSLYAVKMKSRIGLKRKPTKP